MNNALPPLKQFHLFSIAYAAMNSCGQTKIRQHLFSIAYAAMNSGNPVEVMLGCFSIAYAAMNTKTLRVHLGLLLLNRLCGDEQPPTYLSNVFDLLNRLCGDERQSASFIHAD